SISAIARLEKHLSLPQASKLVQPNAMDIMVATQYLDDAPMPVEGRILRVDGKDIAIPEIDADGNVITEI
ncbi:hypothetical protein LCGC14_2475160, partial [marine sediment metagenome]